MTRDDMYQVIYKCSVCGKSKAIDDTSLKRIAKEFDNLGWGNVPEYQHGKTEYIVYCPTCYSRYDDVQDDLGAEVQQRVDREMAAAFDEDMQWDADQASNDAGNAKWGDQQLEQYLDENMAEMHEAEYERAAFMSGTR